MILSCGLMIFLRGKMCGPLCFDFELRGGKHRRGFKFYSASDAPFYSGDPEGGETDITADQVKALVLTCKYDGSGLTLVTGTAFHTFIMDKSVDVLWDRTVRTFLTKKGIGFDEL